MECEKKQIALLIVPATLVRRKRWLATLEGR